VIRTVADWEPYGDNSHILYLDCGHEVIIYFKTVPSEHQCAICDQVRIEFIKPWGHPTRNQILGTGDRCRCSRQNAKILVDGGYARYLDPQTGGAE
jgi:hypothetical protein